MQFEALMFGIVSSILLLSGGLKLAQPRSFREFVSTIGIGRSHPRLVYLGVPWLEIVGGVLLISPAYRVGAVTVTFTSVLFVVVAGKATRTRDGHGCGCFGALDSVTPHWFTAVRASLLATAAGCCLALSLSEDAARPTRELFLLSIGLLAGAALAAASTLLAQMLTFGETLRSLLEADL